MNAESLTKLWSAIGASLLYLTLNAWSASQKFPVKLPGLTFEELDPYNAVLPGIFLGAPLLLLLLLVQQAYQRRVREESWVTRMPVAFGLSIDNPKDGIARIYQAIILVLFVAVPVAGQVHFVDKLFRGQALERTSGDPVAQGITHLTNFFPPSVLWTSDYVFADAGKGMTFFPFWEPWLVILLEGSTLVAAVLSVRGLLAGAGHRPSKKAATQ